MSILLFGWLDSTWANSLQLSPGNTDQTTKSQDNPDIQLNATKGASETMLLRRLQAKNYHNFEQHIQPVQASLAEALSYLKSLSDNPFSVQRLSALTAEVLLDWANLQKMISKHDQNYRSYQRAKHSVILLQALRDDWVENEQRKTNLNEDLSAEKTLQAQTQIVVTELEAALEQMKQMAQLKQDLNDEFPY